MPQSLLKNLLYISSSYTSSASASSCLSLCSMSSSSYSGSVSKSLSKISSLPANLTIFRATFICQCIVCMRIGLRLEMMLMLLTKVRDTMMKMTVVEEYLMMKMAMVEDQLMKKTELLAPLSQHQHFHPAQLLHSYSAEVAFSSSLTGSWPHYDTSRYQCCDAATNSPEPSSYPSVSCGSRSHAWCLQSWECLARLEECVHDYHRFCLIQDSTRDKTLLHTPALSLSCIAWKDPKIKVIILQVWKLRPWFYFSQLTTHLCTHWWVNMIPGTLVSFMC